MSWLSIARNVSSESYFELSHLCMALNTEIKDNFLSRETSVAMNLVQIVDSIFGEIDTPMKIKPVKTFDGII